MTVKRKNSLGMYFLDVLPWDLYLKRKTLDLGIGEPAKSKIITFRGDQLCMETALSSGKESRKTGCL